MMLRTAKPYAFIALAVVILLVVSCATTVKTGPSSSKSSAETSAFKINKFLGRGVNLGNALEAPNEGEWGVTLKEEYFSIIKQAGFNSVRLPVRWSAHALAEKPYTINPDFFKRVDWAVNCAIKNNLYIMLNIQRYDPLTADPNSYHFERFLALWQRQVVAVVMVETLLVVQR